MKKEEFMKKLEYLLQDVNEEEREAALAYVFRRRRTGSPISM